jgi:aldose 1-epimerase
MKIDSTTYGVLPSGEAVTEFTLLNAGLMLKAISYGGIITELHVPDRYGNIEDIVLGLPGLEAYLAGHPWLGAIVGRVAGRISAGSFQLDGETIQLEINDPPNHLHGGNEALDKKNWFGETGVNREHEPFIRFSYNSPDGECGYPGNVEFKVTYTLTNDASLRIDYAATTDRATPISLTNHSYFNLGGESAGSTGKHMLQIHADYWVPADENYTLSGSVEPLVGMANDFNQSKQVDEPWSRMQLNHGDNYMIRRDDKKALVPVARVEDPATGRVMEVESTEACLQFYNAKFLGAAKVIGKCGRLYLPHDGLCFECHGYPDGVNHPEVDDIVIRPPETYSQTTLYRFGISPNGSMNA